MDNRQLFLDANAILYALDETCDYYPKVVKIIQNQLDNGVMLCTSHHVIEEVLHVARKISGTSSAKVIKEISKIPDLVLVEPDATLDFDVRYALLSDKLNIGVNDALVLQLMVDSGITGILSYDKKCVESAAVLGIAKPRNY